MSAEGRKTTVLRANKVRNKLKGDFSWLQRQNGSPPEAEEEKPWVAEVRACRLNSAFAESSPVSSPTQSAPSPTKAAPSPTKAAPSPTKAEPGRSPSGSIVRGVFPKLDKPASPAPTNNSSGPTQFAKKPSENYKKIAPHTVRSTSENQEGPLTPEEKEKRTEAASNVLRRSAARERSYVFSATRKFESPQKDNGAAEAKSPPFVAKRVEITDDDEGSKASATPTSPVSPVASAASVPQPRPRKTADGSVKAAVDVSVNEPAAPKQDEAEKEKEKEMEKEEAVAPEPVKEDSPAVSVTESDPSAEMKPGCTKVYTPLPELTPESFRAVIAEVEPAESDAPRKLVPPLLKLIPATPESLSPTLEPESPAPAAPVPEPSAPESTKPPAPEPSVPSVPAPSVPAPSVAEPSATESTKPSAPEPSVPAPSVAEPSAAESPAPSVPEPSVSEPSVPETPAPSVPEPSAAESPAPSVPEPSVAEPSTPESPAPSVPEPSVAESPAPSVPEPSVAEPSAPESPAPSVPEPSVAEPSVPEPPAPSVAEPSAAEPPAPSVPEPSIAEPPAPSVAEPSAAELSVPDSPGAVAPALTIPESATLVSITPEPQVPESADAASPVPESPHLAPLTPESPAPALSVMDSPSPVYQAPDLLIPECLPISAHVESTASVVLEPPAPAPEPPGPDSPAAVSPPPETPVVPVTDLLAPESATPVPSYLQTLVPVSPPQVTVVTEALQNTALEPEPEPESSTNISSSADTLAALSDTLISFDSGSASVKSREPALAEEEGSSADVRPTDHHAELEPVPQLSNCVQMTDDLLALSDGPEASAEPVPPSPGRWSQDLLGGIGGESSQVKVGGALDVLADDVIIINTEARSRLNTQPEEETPAAAEGTQSPTETVTITTKTVIITDKGEQFSADPVQTSHETTIITESSSADPFDPRPIGTTSRNRASDLLLPLSDASVNRYSTKEKEPSPAETNMSSNVLASLADDVIPIDTGAASLSTQRTWARTWDTGTDADKSQEAGVEGQDAEQKLVVMFERKSQENDSPWDRWTSPTVYTVASEEEEEEERAEDAQQTQTVTTITTVRETWSEPEPAMDRGFVYVKEYVNSTEQTSNNARDAVPSWSDLTESSTTYSYSSPSTYSSGPLSSLCTYCGEPVGNDAKITIEHLDINCHTGCFKCNVCSKPMGDLLDDMFIHRGKVNCESCYSKAFD
ncbi:zinc finger protein 185 isoform X2 [Nelusetta ayraudi]|uniref:zinc finger protein 185 isoform X2 n=1 Tax=Nelusetta ayraudi TaxID=303726 RepID=UPI003F727C6F